MQPSIRCKLVYKNSPHLQQIYAGFARLQALGIIDLLVEEPASDPQLGRQPILYATIDDRFNVVYDALDGLNWIPGTVEENLAFFQKTFHADFYFKRSFDRRLTEMALSECRVLPLGLNYHVRSERLLVRLPIKENLRAMVRNNAFASKILGLKNEEMGLPPEDYEYFPIIGSETKILFLTRIWNPADFETDRRKVEIEAINQSRVSAIKTCQKEFGKAFCGGLTDDGFARNYAGSLVAPVSLTNKRHYLELVRSHAVCIATTGLHGSTGWKFSEYVAAARGIVTEPLRYEVPGDFKSEQNYLEFTNEDELIAGISDLVRNRRALVTMMQYNARYYNNYLRPENLVFNTLLRVLEEN
jgi:hypothetical protein